MERVSLALALGLAASRLEEQSEDPEVVAVAEELTRLSALMCDRLLASRRDDPDDDARASRGGSCGSLVAPRDIAGAGFEPATFGL